MKTAAHIIQAIAAQGHGPCKLDKIADQITTALAEDPAIKSVDWCGNPDGTVRVFRPSEVPLPGVRPPMVWPCITVGVETLEPGWVFDGTKAVGSIAIDLWMIVSPSKADGLASGEGSLATIAAYVQKVATIQPDGKPRMFIDGEGLAARQLIHSGPNTAAIRFEAMLDGQGVTAERRVTILMTFAMSQGNFTEI